MKIVLITAISYLFQIINILILIRVVISWIPNLRESRFGYGIYQLTEPILAPVREMIFRSSFGRNMMLDFSPIVAYFLLRLIQGILIRIISMLPI